MPRPSRPYLAKQVTRHNKTIWYVRRRPNPKVRLRAEYGTPEFWDEYSAAVSGAAVKPSAKAEVGTLGWLWENYRASSAWLKLSRATKRQRENIMLGVLKKAGKESFRKIRKSDIAASRDDRASTPAQARNFLDAMRGLFRWAEEVGHIQTDPTAGVKNPPRSGNGEGFKVWTEADVERYQKRWPIGTKERVWLDVLLYTGLRRGDVVKIGPDHVADGIASMQTEKSQKRITVTIPILAVLKKTLDAGPVGSKTFICGDRGNALTKESFGNVFKDAALKAGVDKSAHGVRKIAATTAANNGATVAELEALFGWQGGQMASLYTRSADRARLAKGAISKLERGASMAQPGGKVVP